MGHSGPLHARPGRPAFFRRQAAGRLPLDIGLALAVGIVIGYNVPWRFRNRVPAGEAGMKDSGDRRGLFELLRTRSAIGAGR